MKLRTETSDKLKKLEHYLEEQGSVSIAYSGGIDSTLLSIVAIGCLGHKNVFVYNVVSSIHAGYTSQLAKDIYLQLGCDENQFSQVELFPLYWKEFVINDEQRCFFCKQQIYKALLELKRKHQTDSLLDGTNFDDLKSHRPGFKAIQDLGILTPLLDVKMTKKEIREIAKYKSLPNHDLSSNSCLATRVQVHTPITQSILKDIADAELYLIDLGFEGCRVRPCGKHTIIEVQTDQIEQLVSRNNRTIIQHKFNMLGFGRVVIDINGRG